MGLVAGCAELRGEVAYRVSGPATAANKYEVPPHGATSLRASPRDCPPFGHMSHDPRQISRGAGVVREDLRDSIHECTSRGAGDRLAGLRRLPSRGLRVVLPQRDRPPAGHARGHPRRHDGRVRHRLRSRYGVAALRRTPRHARSSPPSSTPTSRPRRRTSSSTTRRSRCSPPTGRRCATRAPTRCCSSTRRCPRTPASTPSPTWSSPAGSSCSTTSRRARSGRRSPTGASTSCARAGSPTSGSPPSR